VWPTRPLPQAVLTCRQAYAGCTCHCRLQQRDFRL